MTTFYLFFNTCAENLKRVLSSVNFSWYNGNTTDFFTYLTVACGASLIFSHMWHKGKGLY